MSARMVWIVESGDYEDRSVFCVADSLDSAVAYIKSEYASPYRVEWDLHADVGDGYTLRGRFEAVPGYSTNHVAWFEIWPEQVRTATTGDAEEGK